MTNRDVRCTDTTLILLRPLEQMDPKTQRALTKWFWRHDITPSVVAVGMLVERDPFVGSLVWRERDPDDHSVTRRWRFAGHVNHWPEVFPAILERVESSPRRLLKRTSGSHGGD